MTPTPNTPSREAMDAAKAICPHEAANPSQGTNRMHLHHVASTIETYFAPIRAELARLRNVPADPCTTALMNAKPNPPDIARAISENLMDLIDAPTDDAKGTPETDAVWRKWEHADWKESFAAMHEHAEKQESALTRSRAEVATWQKRANERDGLLVEIATLQRDKERLDALQYDKKGNTVGYVCVFVKYPPQPDGSKNGEYPVFSGGKKVREIIDMAIDSRAALSTPKPEGTT